MLNGTTGKILHVDLTSLQVEVEQPPEEFYRTYFGGSAMGLYYLLRHTPPGADPLGPDNTLSFMLSPTTGVPVSGQSRATATAKSPVTGLVGDSQSGGFWPAELKFAGFDGIVIHGRSERPIYLWIHDGETELREAAHLTGRLTGDVDRAIREELGDNRTQVIQAGPAGERLVRFASIMSMANRAFGRTGMGAVMASKNLKAIAVRGHGKVQVANRAGVTALARQLAERLEAFPDVKGMQDMGTASVLNFQNQVGGLPTRNYSSGIFEAADDISGERMTDTILKHNDTCWGCGVRCKRVVETEYAGEHVDPLYGGPEYETLAAFGSYCGVRDLAAVSLANQIAAEQGMDTITCGATIAFAMECFQQGLLSREDTGGLDLRFGNAKAMVEITRMIAERKGLGDLLAEGSARAAERIGHGAESFVVAVKGHELPAHMPQVKRSLALIYAVNPFGADHQSSEHDPGYAPEAYPSSLERLAHLGLVDPQPDNALNREKVKLALRTQWTYGFLDSANLCQFVWGPSWQLYGPVEMASLLSAVTGWDVCIDELQRIGERRLNMMRLFNAREGAGRALDTLPKRLFDEPLSGGPSDGVAVDRQEFEEALSDYYRMCGWDVETGIPMPEKIHNLGLAWAL